MSGDANQNPEHRIASTGIVCLISGGVDSAVMLGLALANSESVHPLYVRQGFLWETEELTLTQRYLHAVGNVGFAGELHPLTVGEMSVGGDYSSRWAVDAGRSAPGANSPDEAVYLPGRNLALLTQGAILAQSRGLSRIQLGSLSTNPFPDATQEFFRKFETVVAEGMQWRVRVETPLGGMHKNEVIERGAIFPLGLTLSCIRPGKGGVHCGRCNKCEERRRAFLEAGIDDPAAFAE